MSSEQLTDLAIRKLAITDERYEVFDGKTPGFGVRVSPSGTKTFILFYRFDGRLQRSTLGRFPILSLKEARQLASDTLNKAARGENPQKQRKADRSATLFPAVIESFARIYCAEHNRPSTAQETERLLRARFLTAWGERDIRTISREDITKILDEALKDGHPSAANHALAAIRKLFSWCVDRGLVETSPCAVLKRPALIRSRERVLKDDELAAIWHATPAVGYTYQQIVQLLILTGQRRGEVAGLRWTEIDLPAKLWSLPAERTKNGRAHAVPLSEKAAAVIRSIVKINDEFLFPALGNPKKSFSGFSKLKQRLDEASGVFDWTLHDLRRTTATGMARLGIAPHVVERVLNHVSGSFDGVAGIYNRFQYEKEMRDAASLWASHIDTLMTSSSA